MKINYKSDFELDYTLLDEQGQPMTPPDCPWKLVLSVGNPLKPYVGQCDCINGRNFVASFDGTQYKNCTVADTVIRVFADNHGLPCGQLWATFITYTPNPDFPDGDRRVYTPQATDTFLVAEAGDDPTPAQIQYTANYVLYDAYYIAAQNGYEGTPEAYYAALVALPTAIGQAVAAAELAEQAKRVALEASSRATQAASAAEGATRDANTATETANAAAATANRASETAGNAATTANNAASAANSAAESATQVATTIQRQYDETMIVMNNQINELIDGKAQIAQALTDRGYPTAPTDSSASMAQKIENMAYDAGWLAQLGYTEQNDGGVKDAVAYSKSIEDGWDAQVTNRNFQNDTKLVFCPRIDTSRYTSMNNFFAGSSLIFMKENDIDMSSVTTAQGMFSATRIAVIPPLSTPLLSGMYLCFNGASVRKIMSLDLSSMPTPSFGNGVVNTEYCVLKNIGKVSNFNWNEANMSNWGNYSEDNRQSLVKTLRDYSFDRVTAGYSACTIKLHANTLARLTQEEIAAITAKGFTLTS